MHDPDHHREACDPAKRILFKEMSEVLLQNIRNYQTLQGALQHFTNEGKIGISSVEQSDIEIEVYGIVDLK